jgi:membrane peptidoglycan carboxypeptidase
MMTVREHLNQSRNIPAVKTLEAASAEVVAARARELGYDVQPFYALALGAFETTPLQHASAFGAFANGGVLVEAHLVTRVEDADGNVLFQAQPRSKQVWSPQTAYLMLDMLHGNVVDRDPIALSWRAGGGNRWVAGKTGTTNDERDIWFVGATPGMTAVVWIGNDDSSPLPRSMQMADGSSETVTSSRQPIYAWNDFVDGALQGRPMVADGFPIPDGIVFHPIDRRTGALSEGGTVAAFRTTTEVSADGAAAALMIEVAVDSRTGQRADADTPFEFIDLLRVDPADLDALLSGTLPSSP